MQYRGRLTLLFLSLAAAWIYIILGEMKVIPFTIFTIIHVILSLFIGNLYDKYRYLSFHDPLTGVYNRRYAYTHFEKRFKRAKRRKEKIGILCIDIDNFKWINDTYGHNHGDFMLKEVCKIIAGTIRKEDILVRWGGDEFLLFIVDSDSISVKHLITQIDETITTELQKCGDAKIVSIGHSIYPEDGENISSLLSIADKRMYREKSIMKEASHNETYTNTPSYG